MYKVMLVEDEDTVREGIAAFVDWQACGFHLCDMAGGGIEAIEKVEGNIPDLIITDISMPYMDGLEMIERLSQTHPTIRYIIISGHDDFDYAQKALRFNVMDYLLKPLAKEGFTAVLHNARRALDEERAELQNLSNLQRRVDANKGMLQRMALLELLADSADDIVPNLEYSVLDGLFPAFVGVILPSSMEQFRQTLQENYNGRTDLMHASIAGIIEDTIGQQGQYIRHKNGYCVLIHADRDIALGYVAVIQEKIKHYLGLVVGGMLTDEIATHAMFAQGYRQARLYLSRHRETNLRTLPKAFEHDTATPEVSSFPERLGQDIANLLRHGNEAEIDIYFDTLTTQLALSPVQEAEIPILLSLVLGQVYQTASIAGLSKETIISLYGNQGPYAAELDLYDELKKLCQLCKEVSQRIEQQSNPNDKALIDRILQFIHENYGNKDLSLELVCTHFHISATQFSLLFKREVGTSFLQYVLDLRIKMAQKMLLETNEKIYTIAQVNGFGDAGYFSYCFKQRCGITPKDFRKQ